MKNLVLLFFVCISHLVISQNLVPNPSFEEYTTCPVFINDFGKLINWNNPSNGSPNYFNICSNGNVGVPNNNFGYQNPFSGNGYIGLCLHTESIENYREYAQIELSEPLVANIKYYVSYYVSLADSFNSATSEICALLTDNSFLGELKYFAKDDKLFAVGFAQTERDGKIVGANRAYFKNGLISHSHRSSTIDHPSSNFWAEGGSSIFKKKIFIDLGSFDELYNPFYWEDIDLSYRAWKSGYKILYDPSIKVEHHHESTIGKYFDRYKILRTAFRNQLIFHWKNMTDKDLILKHLFNIPRYIFLPGFFDALRKLPEILKSRKKTIKLFVKSDKEILEIFK